MDAAGLYQVGSFIETAGRSGTAGFRDDVRAFFRGEPGSAGRAADRLVGSPEIYGHEEREVEQSVNFVTCHDSFTLNDLVSYGAKHNEANGEDNRDGRTTTAAGTAAWRGRPTIRPSRSFGVRR